MPTSGSSQRCLRFLRLLNVILRVLQTCRIHRHMFLPASFQFFLFPMQTRSRSRGRVQARKSETGVPRSRPTAKARTVTASKPCEPASSRRARDASTPEVAGSAEDASGATSDSASPRKLSTLKRPSTAKARTAKASKPSESENNAKAVSSRRSRNAPVQAQSVGSTSKPTRSVDDDDVIIVGHSGHGHDACVDLPHERGDCAVHAFKRAPPGKLSPEEVEANAKRCPRCFCYICDRAANVCIYWRKSNHCCAFRGHPLWELERAKHIMKLRSPEWQRSRPIIEISSGTDSESYESDMC